jgi:predicted nuclease with TOPRIM domain
MSDDKSIFGRIDELVAEEHELRTKHAAGQVKDDDERARLQALEVELDQCWDLLRQRRAKREFGENPDDAQARDAGTVEGYLG